MDCAHCVTTHILQQELQSEAWFTSKDAGFGYKKSQVKDCAAAFVLGRESKKIKN